MPRTPRPSEDAARALAQCGGTADTATLLRVVTRHQLRHAVERKQVLNVGKGRYALPGLDAEPALRCGGVLGGLSAALAHGWAVKQEPPRPVVLIPANGRKPTGVEQHWGLPPSSHVVDHVTTPARTAVDCAKWLPFDEAVCVIDAALRHGIKPDELRHALLAAPRPGRRRARAVVDAGDPGAASVLETLVRVAALEVEGLSLETQVQIGRHRVDLADRRLRIVVECDSFAFHGDAAAFTRDVRRYTELVQQGWTVVRFAWADAMHDPGWIRQVLGDVVAARRKEGRCSGCGVAA